MVYSQHATWIGFSDESVYQSQMAMVEMQIVDDKHIAFKLMILLMPEQIGSDKQQFQFFELVQFEDFHLLLCLLVTTENPPTQLGQSAQILHLAHPKGRVLSHHDSCALYFLVQDMQQPGHGLEGHIRQPTELLALLQPLADLPDFFCGLEHGLGVVAFGGGGGVGVGGVKEVLHVFIEADFEDGLLEEGAFDVEISLVVDILAYDFSEVGLIGIHVLQFFLHLNISVNVQQYMDNGQNRTSVRGPLIAVIKIEIDSNRTDRIFLHQHDNDQGLAQEFINKHRLNPILTHHIYERIKYSRESVEQNEHEQKQTSRGMDYADSNYKLQTPVNQLASHRQLEQHPTTSDLNIPHQPSVQGEKQAVLRENANNKHRSRPTYSYLQEQFIFTDRKQENRKITRSELWNEAPSKQQVLQERQFMIYDNNNQESLDNSDMALFPGSNRKQTNGGNIHKKEGQEVFQSEKVNPVREIMNSQHKSNKIMQFLEQKDKQQTLRVSNSVTHFNAPKLYTQTNQKMHTQNQQNRKSATKQYSKPTHVKILRKEDIQSLNQSLKKSMSQNEISRINKDVTRRLYNQGSIKKNYLNIIREKAKKEKQSLNDAELTHRPQINRISQVIAEGRKKDHATVEMYLIDEGKRRETKRAEQQGRKLMEELNACTFKPELNLISEKLAADREELQNRLKMRQSEKRSRYRDENKFRPELNTITRELMKDKGGFQQRQREFLQVKNSKLLNLVKQKIQKEKKDKQTGQELFKPKINDLGLRESQGPNIGNYLYSLSKLPKEQPESKPAQPRISSTSEAIVRQMHTNRLTWLFSELDSDQDGVISAQRINIETISPEILGIIKPILFQMQEMNEQLNLEEFMNAVSVLHKKLTTLQRDKLYNAQKAR